jgi:basic membrane lipoprotein Med (substrate-binding protein (PBP1-ABC) superfamily)
MRVRLSENPRSARRRFRGVAITSVAAIAAVVLAACGGTTGSETSSSTSESAASSESAPADSGSASSDKPLVYGVFATPLEEPWDGAVHQALQAAADAGEIVYKHTDNNDSDDKMTRTLTDLLTNEKPDIVFGDAFSSESAVRDVAKNYPKVQFAFGSGEDTVDPNFSTFDNWLQDPGYLAGMLAGGVTKSGTIGVVAAMPIPEVNRIVNAFIKGVAETNSSATVKVTFINSFFDPTTAKQAALAQVAQGADVLFAERAGVIEAAKEKNLPVIGMMVDQQSEAPKNVMTSLVWNMRPTVDEVIKEFKAGSLHSQNLGQFSFMKNGGSSLAPINSDVPGGIPQDLIDKVTAKQKDIMDGAFETPIDESAPAGSTTVGQ